MPRYAPFFIIFYSAFVIFQHWRSRAAEEKTVSPNNKQSISYYGTLSFLSVPRFSFFRWAEPVLYRQVSTEKHHFHEDTEAGVDVIRQLGYL